MSTPEHASHSQIVRNRISRAWSQVNRFLIAMDFDERDYTADRITTLQNAVHALNARLEQLESSAADNQDKTDSEAFA